MPPAAFGGLRISRSRNIRQTVATQNKQQPPAVTTTNKQPAPGAVAPNKNAKSLTEEKQKPSDKQPAVTPSKNMKSLAEAKQTQPTKNMEKTGELGLPLGTTQTVPRSGYTQLQTQKSRDNLPDDLKPLTRQQNSKESFEAKTRRSNSLEAPKLLTRTRKSKDSVKTAKAASRDKKSNSQEGQARAGKKKPTKKSTTDSLANSKATPSETTQSKTKEDKKLKSKGTVATDENSEEDLDEEDEFSEEVELLQTRENMEMEEALVVEKLSRLGCRGTLAKDRISFLFIMLAYLNGYDVLSRYAFYIGRFGNGFIFVYLVLMIVVGFPLIYMEYALGQYSASTGYNVFRRIAPAFAGVGVASLVLNAMQMVTDQMMIPYFMDLVYHTSNFFADSMPWHNCVSDYNTPACRDVHHTCAKWQKELDEMPEDVRGSDSYSFLGNLCYLSRMRINRMDSFEDWQLKNINEQPLHKWLAGESMGQHLLWNVNITSSSIGYATWPATSFLFQMLVAWLAIYFICKYAQKHIGKMATCSWIFCMAAMATLAIWILVLEPPDYTYISDKNPFYMFEAEAMVSMEIFVSAISLTFTSLRLGQGGWAFLGSQNSFHNNTFKDCLFIFTASIVPLFVYSVAHTMSFNSYILYLVEGSMEKWEDTMQRITDREQTYFYWTGYALPQFVLYLSSLRVYHEFEPLLVWMLSSMCTLMTLMNKIVRMEIIVATLTEMFPILTSTLGTSCRSVLLHLTLCFSLLWSIYLAGPNGMETIIGLENYTFPLLSATIVVAQCICVGWCYGGLRLMSNITAMNNRRNDGEARMFTNAINFITAYLWSLVVPLTIWALYLVYMWVGADGTHTNIDMGESLMAWLGIVLIVFVLATNAVYYHRKEGNREKIFVPQRVLWGPRSTEDRLFGEKWERKNRVIH